MNIETEVMVRCNEGKVLPVIFTLVFGAKEQEKKRVLGFESCVIIKEVSPRTSCSGARGTRGYSPTFEEALGKRKAIEDERKITPLRSSVGFASRRG